MSLTQFPYQIDWNARIWLSMWSQWSQLIAGSELGFGLKCPGQRASNSNKHPLSPNRAILVVPQPILPAGSGSPHPCASWDFPKPPTSCFHPPKELRQN
uniref:HDC12176 n=1 Tax=Drosophila melanogaster TaxID=7227 RepID=Q6IKL3_DROME|nr:TPA_inf: HDC12176 [Drosophila melanogaster]